LCIKLYDVKAYASWTKKKQLRVAFSAEKESNCNFTAPKETNMSDFTSQLGSHLDPKATTLTRHLMSTLMADEVDENGPGCKFLSIKD